MYFTKMASEAGSVAAAVASEAPGRVVPADTATAVPAVSLTSDPSKNAKAHSDATAALQAEAAAGEADKKPAKVEIDLADEQPLFDNEEPYVARDPGKRPEFKQSQSNANGWDLLVDTLANTSRQTSGQMQWATDNLFYKRHQEWNEKRKKFNQENDKKFGDKGFRYSKADEVFNKDKRDRIQELEGEVKAHQAVINKYKDKNPKDLKPAQHKELETAELAKAKGNALISKLKAIKNLDPVEHVELAQPTSLKGFGENLMQWGVTIPRKVRDGFQQKELVGRIGELKALSTDIDSYKAAKDDLQQVQKEAAAADAEKDAKTDADLDPITAAAGVSDAAAPSVAMPAAAAAAPGLERMSNSTGPAVTADAKASHTTRNA